MLGFGTHRPPQLTSTPDHPGMRPACTSGLRYMSPAAEESNPGSFHGTSWRDACVSPLGSRGARSCMEMSGYEYTSEGASGIQIVVTSISPCDALVPSCQMFGLRKTTRTQLPRRVPTEFHLDPHRDVHALPHRDMPRHAMMLLLMYSVPPLHLHLHHFDLSRRYSLYPQT